MIMKKFILFLFFILGFTYAHSQFSVELLKYRDIYNLNSSGDQITVMEIDTKGNIWFNLVNNQGGAGLGKFTGNEWINFSTGDLVKYLSPTVNTIAFDLKDSVWVGTDKGLAQFDGVSTTGWKFYNKSNSAIPDNKITAITVDIDNIKWIGCSNGILASFDGNAWNIYSEYEGLVNSIKDLETDQQGNIWVARDGWPGLLKFTNGEFTTFPALTDVRNIEIDGNGRVLVTSKYSLIIISNDAIVQIVQPDQLRDFELYDVEASSTNGVFVSSNKGLFRQDGPTFRLYSKENSNIPDLVPPENFNPVPIVFNNSDSLLWFSFIYNGVLAEYGSIGYLALGLPFIVPPPVPVDRPDYTFCYGESITLDAGGSATNYIWDGISSTSRTFTLYDTRAFNLTRILEEKCSLEDTIKITINDTQIDSIICLESSQTTLSSSVKVIAQHVYENEVPCVATVSSDYKNLVAWERTPEVGTASYNIYKETIPDSFEFLDNIPVGQLSIYKDNLSDPRRGSSKYKIASVDTCGNESGKSYYHKTMYLEVSFGIDTTEVILTWQKYEGFWIPYYIIYKGTDPDDLQPYDSISGDAETLTWTDYKVDSLYYYGVGVQLPVLCAPAQGKKADSGPYSHSMSNIEDNRFQTSIKDQGITEIQSYPNPFSQWTKINFENPKRIPYQLKVTDMSGKIVRIINDITDNGVILLRENLPQGFYLFELKGDQVYRGKFIIK
jgi:hypothetical protein